MEARVVAVGDEMRNGTEGVTPRKKDKGNKGRTTTMTERWKN